ncbi:hypothetical protein ACFQY4_26305 [Catellatospora bangladeshensis]|uniref:Uncharacterized protein n=1 Tax=Catellatospora bangladeshensis TaxID=310355 RepID=A0A8J3JVX5_9ACTN|nr:hypothetical protein [Catellatospora bangladeshensis]GIF86028.1 hypothetical protein Cba03nite_73770 [Catellatospora bangladeshensis]
MGLATSAHDRNDAEQASTAFNGAALLASDCGDADLAAHWCRWHANLYLTKPKIDARGIRYALEPVVNLARLLTRAGDGSSAHRLLTNLHHAVTTRTAASIGGVDIPADRWDPDIAHHPELLDWLQRVLLTDGTRALVTAGQWQRAAEHAHQRQGITDQLHEGRQVAILAATLNDDPGQATELLLATRPHEDWERSIQAVLQAMCNPLGRKDLRRTILGVIARQQPTTGQGLAVYRTRLGLTAIDLALPALDADSHRYYQQLCDEALADQDGHAIVDLLRHPLAPSDTDHPLHEFRRACGLGRGELPVDQRTQLRAALHQAARAIADDVPSQAASHWAAFDPT